MGYIKETIKLFGMRRLLSRMHQLSLSYLEVSSAEGYLELLTNVHKNASLNGAYRGWSLVGVKWGFTPRKVRLYSGESPSFLQGNYLGGKKCKYMQSVNMYANKNGDANKCIAISEFHKNFLVFANPSSNRSEGLCLRVV
jgi:hypothetical protein